MSVPPNGWHVLQCFVAALLLAACSSKPVDPSVAAAERATQVLNFMVEGNAQGFNESIAPDVRQAPGQPKGMAWSAADYERLRNCKDVRLVGEPTIRPRADGSNMFDVTFTWEVPCVFERQGTWNNFTLAIEKSGENYYYRGPGPRSLR
jgi:hypothetical protein